MQKLPKSHNVTFSYSAAYLEALISENTENTHLEVLDLLHHYFVSGSEVEFWRELLSPSPTILKDLLHWCHAFQDLPIPKSKQELNMVSDLVFEFKYQLAMTGSFM